MIREILGVTLVTVIVSVIAAVAVVGMVLLVGATNTLTDTVFNDDRTNLDGPTHLVDLMDDCGAFQIAACELALSLH